MLRAHAQTPGDVGLDVTGVLSLRGYWASFGAGAGVQFLRAVASIAGWNHVFIVSFCGRGNAPVYASKFRDDVLLGAYMRGDKSAVASWMDGHVSSGPWPRGAAARALEASL